MPALDQSDDIGQFRVRVDDRLRIVTSPEFIDFVDGEPEQEEVLFAHGLPYLDVGAVQRADRDGAIHHELHIAGPGRFLARR